MANYLELRARGEKLLAEAEDLRVKEFGEVIEDIKQKMKAYGLTAQDIGLSRAGATGVRRKKKSAGGAAKPKAKARFRGPNGETWSGRGLTPRWLATLVSQGTPKEDFAIRN